MPGATLTDVPDAPGRPGLTGPAENSWLGSAARPAGETPSQAASTTFPTRQGDSGGFPLRAPSGPNPEGEPIGSAPGLDLPVRNSMGYTAPPNAFGGSSPAPYGNDPLSEASGEQPSTGFPQRVPGAALGSGGSLPASGSGAVPSPAGSASVPPAGAASVPPVAPQAGSASVPVSSGSAAVPAPTSGAVPQPREAAASWPATGSARPVTASVSVPGRVAPPAEGTEIPPATAAPQARVYGRPAPAAEEPVATPVAEEPPFGGSPFPGARMPETFPSAPDPAPSTNPFAQRAPESPFAPSDGSDPGAANPFAQGAAGGQANPFAQERSPFAPDAAPSTHERSPFEQQPESADGPFGARPEGFGSFPPPQRGEENSGGFGSFPPPQRGEENPGGFGGFPPAPGEAAGPTPQSPARATARASASARVSPPEPGAPSAPISPSSGSARVAPYDDGAQGAPPFPAPGAAPSFPSYGGGEEASFPPPSSSFAGAPAATPFGPPGSPAQPNPFGPPPTQPNPFGAAPQGAPAWGDFATGAPAAPGSDQFSEHTTDVSGRGNSPYVPAPALPQMPNMPGSDPFGADRTTRATVTPPGPEDTTSWPGPAEQDKFDQFKGEEPPAPPKVVVKTGPVTLAVVFGAALLLVVVFGLVWLISGGGSGDSFSAGDCVKNGDKVTKVACSETDAYQVKQVVDSKDQCTDTTQPYIVAGKKVYCLVKPAG
ncbi:hypothetical protein Areg01_69460 [Actinoplanes regularis]|nr:hypothetical protein Areg01_69460 [Actinoplanes regularis]